MDPTQPGIDWFADDAFWEALYPLLLSAREMGEKEVAAVLALAGRPANAVLDLCCGAGRHSIPLAKRGARVTGVDRSPFLLGHARRYASDAGANVRWVQADMREFVEPASFDLAVNLFTSFGYFEEPADNQRVLANVHTSLAPGGAFVIEVAGREVIARIFQPTRSQELPDGSLMVTRAKVIDDWTRIENDWRFLQDGKFRSFRFRHWLYSATELRDMLKAAGFAQVDVFGDLQGSPYGVEATRLVARACKAG